MNELSNRTSRRNAWYKSTLPLTKTEKESERKALASSPLPESLSRLGIDNWDAVIIGDGSGTRWEHPVGWASVVMTPNPDGGPVLEKVFFGGASCGTNILAEMLAYLIPLDFLSCLWGTLAGKTIWIITDCEYLVEASNSSYPRSKHQELWQFFDTYSRRGAKVHWKWIPRDSMPANVLSHDTANLGRIAIKNTQIV